MDPVSIIGLAASIVQLGDFALKSITTLSKIRDSIKNGSKDLQAIQNAISCHANTLDRFTEIAFSTKTRSEAEEKLVLQFQQQILQFKDALKEYSKLMKKTNPTMFSGKKTGLAETAVRMLLKGDEIRKYLEVLDKQISIIYSLRQELAGNESRDTQVIVQNFTPQIASIHESLEIMNRRIAPRQHLSDPLASRTSKVSGVTLPNITNGAVTCRWTSRSFLSALGSFQCYGAVDVRNVKKPAKKGSILSESFIDFTFNPKAFFSSYMIAFRASWAQSSGSSIHIGLKPMCHRIITDAATLELFGPSPGPLAVECLLSSGVVSANDVLLRPREFIEQSSLLEGALIAMHFDNYEYIYEVCHLLLKYGAEVTSLPGENVVFDGFNKDHSSSSFWDADNFRSEILHFGTLQMYQYFIEDCNRPANYFNLNDDFENSFMARNIEIFHSLLSKRKSFSIEEFQGIIDSQHLWTTLAVPEGWDVILSKIPAPNEGCMSPYLHLLLHPMFSESSVGLSELADRLIQRGDATTCNGFILGKEVLQLVLNPEVAEKESYPGRYTHSVESILSLLVSYPDVDLEIGTDGLFYRQDMENRHLVVFEEIVGFTPLMIAVYAGYVSVTAILVNAGAGIQNKALCGFSAIQLARHNAQGDHPRKVDWTKCKEYGTRRIILSISLETDMETLRLLEGALITRTDEEETEPASTVDGELILSRVNKQKKLGYRDILGLSSRWLQFLVKGLNELTVMLHSYAISAFLLNTAMYLLLAISIFTSPTFQISESFRFRTIFTFFTRPIVIIFIAVTLWYVRR
ncbi:Ankyrin repeat-containing protein [Glarea lozoyensis ATCC 20868]|uniref:Ankyrin repeat-containing protein n=1 Tax=Glarea lozoyensis (strain ATCC 20868 / MF5171) TaxID=1116229 RepID=S3EG35_GLAL2|nr:Ankyrin repeat-containing protein [Glarea lozoyensis ATCC 20868]EPE37143.1 Ankyrin repeat-containing protein [Glarea lozoyensis ATCC 20868]